MQGWAKEADKDDQGYCGQIKPWQHRLDQIAA
jgi:hypothetical protein